MSNLSTEYRMKRDIKAVGNKIGKQEPNVKVTKTMFNMVAYFQCILKSGPS